MEYDIQDIPVEQLDILEADVEPVDRETIDDLKADLSTRPLLHALTVICDRSGGELVSRFFIKAGRKRFYALRELGKESIPCLVLPNGLSDDEIQEITISENLKRYNLPWWEQVVKRAELHALRQKQHGVGRQGKKTGWSLRDTAEEMGIGFGTLSEDLRLADAVMANPNLRKIEDKRTAKRLIFHEAKRMEAEAEAGLDIKAEYNCVLCGNSAEILKFYPDNTFDVVFTDPPWLEYKDERLVKDDETIKVFKEVFRVMKSDSFLYAIVSTPDFILYQKQLPEFGFKVQQMPLIWVKQNVISHGLRSWEYGRDYEPILLAVKGNPVLNLSGQISAVYSSPAVHPSRLIHPNEKPVDVPTHFLSHCTYDGSMVLDPFGGSGVTAEACKTMGRRYVIIERDKKYADNIERRLASSQASSE